MQEIAWGAEIFFQSARKKKDTDIVQSSSSFRVFCIEIGRKVVKDADLRVGRKR